MEIMKVKGNTYCIDTGMSYIPFYKINDEEVIMMDTGWAKGEREGIVGLLEGNGLRVAGIINSHVHIDHAGNNAYFKDKYNSVIVMSAYEAYFCSSLTNLKVYFRNRSLSEVEEHLGHLVCETDIMVTEDQNKIYVCGVKFRILHTPGHSPAHMCIITPDDVAYLGDALISSDVMSGAKMPYAYILKTDLESKEKLYDLSCCRYIVAHKGIYDNITKLIYDNIVFYKKRAKRIYDIIEGAMTKEEIFRAVTREFSITINNSLKYAVIERMFISYLEYLQDTGMVETVLDDGFMKYVKRETDIA